MCVEIIMELANKKFKEQLLSGSPFCPIKREREEWIERVTRVRNLKNVQRNLVYKPHGRNHFRVTVIDG